MSPARLRLAAAAPGRIACFSTIAKFRGLSSAGTGLMRVRNVGNQPADTTGSIAAGMAFEDFGLESQAGPEAGMLVKVIRFR